MDLAPPRRERASSIIRRGRVYSRGLIRMNLPGKYMAGAPEERVKRAIHYNSLAAKGIEVHGVDCLLATYCLEHGMALLTDPPTAEPFVRHLGLRVPST